MIRNQHKTLDCYLVGRVSWLNDKCDINFCIHFRALINLVYKKLNEKNYNSYKYDKVNNDFFVLLHRFLHILQLIEA
jgi:hypothetical protein